MGYVSLPARARDYVVKALEAFWRLMMHARPTHPMRKLAGPMVHRMICLFQERKGTQSTRFFRNVPLLDALASLQLRGGGDEALRVAILGCSTGAEAYSVAWALRLACPELKLRCIAIDIVESAVAAAREGVYASTSRALEGVPDEMLDLAFERRSEAFYVRDDLRQDVTFMVGDACSEELLDKLGPQDIVTANNFLVHMSDEAAEACLYRIGRTVAPGGVLVVWGINPEIRTRVMTALGFAPLPVNLEDIHQADRPALEAWPLKWWGLEPLDKSRPDWPVRYCTIFRKVENSPLAVS
jgi:chemotaxis methyl-accepting protein methylase